MAKDIKKNEKGTKKENKSNAADKLVKGGLTKEEQKKLFKLLSDYEVRSSKK